MCKCHQTCTRWKWCRECGDLSRIMASDESSIPALDGLRGFACLLVLFSHAGWAGLCPRLPIAGHLGVMVFFTLSGFLMAYLYMPGRLSMRYWLAFLLRR